jgi:hypothetical protein
MIYLANNREKGSCVYIASWVVLAAATKRWPFDLST